MVVEARTCQHLTSLEGLSQEIAGAKQYVRASQKGDAFLKAAVLRILAFGELCWGPIHGNYHMGFQGIAAGINRVVEV